MTELEKRLMDALGALSAEWDAEQHQHADEQDMLSVRIDDLVRPSEVVNKLVNVRGSRA